jgi:16S rRNA (cytosine967-C5)-methyltransferase
MRAGARAAAAIEILDDIDARKRPATQALKDWGLSHRFAGSGDRAVIGNLVFDVLRQKSSLAWRMGDEKSRAMIIGTLHWVWGLSQDDIALQFDGSTHAPMTLTEAEIDSIANGNLTDSPEWVKGDYPQWLHDSMVRQFGEQASEEGAAQASRAPVDLRANLLKADRAKILKALARFSPEETPISPLGIRIPSTIGAGRSPAITAETGYNKGRFEVQDEGSQLATMLAGAEPGQQVADICAGAGGKTLALSAIMGNKGQIHAFDIDRHRFRKIHERLRRAGTRNVQVIDPGDNALAPLTDRMDLVLVDAPCTGTGTWRRHPDAKWRMREGALATRKAEQSAALEMAAPLVKPGGRIVYVTCSILAEENGDQVRAFLTSNENFRPGKLDPDTIEKIAEHRGESSSAFESKIQLTPLRDSTDGFFVACMERIS